MKRKSIFSTIFLWLLPISALWAQQPQPEISLDPVTVTSSLIERRSSEIGRSITIIKGDVFSKLPIHSLDELLRYVPGIEIQARGPQGTQSDISMRGSTFQQVLVILDGLRLNDPNTGHFNTYIPIAPAEIDRIEILKGASSALYGSDAVGGVINIITKAFHAKEQKAKPQLNGQFAAGQYGLVHTNMGGFFKSGALGIGAGLLTNHATGAAQRGTRGFFHNNAASAGIHYQLSSNWSIAYRGAFDYRNFSAQNFYTTSPKDTATEKISSWWHQARVGFDKGKTNINLDMGYKKLNDHYVFFPGFSPNDNKTELLQAVVTYKQWVGDQTAIVSGLNFQNKKIQSNDRGNHQLHSIAPFFTAVHKIGPFFSLLPALRWEMTQGLPVAWVPNLTLSYKQKAWQLRASGGKTIRDADFTERYNNFGKLSVPGGNRMGNPELAMETSWGYEAGIDWFLAPTIKFSTTVFNRFNTNLIDWVSTPYADMPRKDNLLPGATYLLAKNIARLRTRGLETDFQLAKNLSSQESVWVQIGVLWQRSRSSETKPSFYIASHARLNANFTAQYTHKHFAMGLTGLYKNREPQSAGSIAAQIDRDYFLLNGKLSYRFANQKMAAFLMADNIFNRQYSDLLGAVMPGRWLQAGVNFEVF